MALLAVVLLALPLLLRSQRECGLELELSSRRVPLLVLIAPCSEGWKKRGEIPNMDEKLYLTLTNVHSICALQMSLLKRKAAVVP